MSVCMHVHIWDCYKSCLHWRGIQLLFMKLLAIANYTSLECSNTLYEGATGINYSLVVYFKQTTLNKHASYISLSLWYLSILNEVLQFILNSSPMRDTLQRSTALCYLNPCSYEIAWGITMWMKPGRSIFQRYITLTGYYMHNFLMVYLSMQIICLLWIQPGRNYHFYCSVLSKVNIRECEME